MLVKSTAENSLSEIWKSVREKSINLVKHLTIWRNILFFGETSDLLVKKKSNAEFQFRTMSILLQVFN